jgi:hypothetical protein
MMTAISLVITPALFLAVHEYIPTHNDNYYYMISKASSIKSNV